MVRSSYAFIWTFEIRSGKRKTFKNSNEGTTIKSIKQSMNEMIGISFNLYNLVIKDLQTETSCQQCTKLRNANCVNCIIDILDFSCCLLSCGLHVTWVNLQKFGWGFITICIKWMISQSTDYFITCYTALTRSIWVATAVHSCNSWLSVWTLSCRCPL